MEDGFIREREGGGGVDKGSVWILMVLAFGVLALGFFYLVWVIF